MSIFPSYFVSADWSRDPRKRSVHVADLRCLKIYYVERTDWNLGRLLDCARRLASAGSVLVGLDVVLGVPQGYWRRVMEEPRWSGARDFIDWLPELGGCPEFFEAVQDAASWRVTQPFFRVPRGKGSLNAFKARAAGCLHRLIEDQTGAKPMFAVSGIPGTVGSATRELWKELIPAISGRRDFAVWPFEGGLDLSVDAPGIVLVETYPRLAYGVTLAERLPTQRFDLAKRKTSIRQDVCDQLPHAAWSRQGVDLGDLAPCRGNEDAFDSFLTAAAVVRCVVEGRSLWDMSRVDPKVEGALLPSGPLELNRSGTRWPRAKKTGQAKAPQRRAAAADYRCPIAGCSKVFYGGRSGWDAHAASLRAHPDWHPGVEDPVDRRELFRRVHGDWLK